MLAAAREDSLVTNISKLLVSGEHAGLKGVCEGEVRRDVVQAPHKPHPLLHRVLGTQLPIVLLSKKSNGGSGDDDDDDGGVPLVPVVHIETRSTTQARTVKFLIDVTCREIGAS